MKRSVDRILTTHAGSLPRPDGLVEMLEAVSRGEAVDEAALAATGDVVKAQAEAGVDVINGGEQSRISFSTYVTQRVSGFGGAWTRRGHRDQLEFPSIERPRVVQLMRDVPMCVGALSYDRLDIAERECDDLLQAVEESSPAHQELFMTAASPGIIALTMKNTGPNHAPWQTVPARGSGGDAGRSWRRRWARSTTGAVPQLILQFGLLI